MFPNGYKKESKRMYALLDEQSNHFLTRSEFFEIFKISGSSYTHIPSIPVRGVQRQRGGEPVVIPWSRWTRKLALICLHSWSATKSLTFALRFLHRKHAHLKRIAEKIPPLDQDVEILLLLGRDILQICKVREQISGPRKGLI